MRPDLQRTLELLELEADAEAQRAKERSQRLSPAEAERVGISLVDLVVDDARGGLGGLYILKLVKRTTGLALPWTRIGAGDPVVLTRESDGTTLGRAVVSVRRDRHVAIAVAEPPDIEEDERLRIDLSSDEITSKRQRAALHRVDGAHGDRLAALRDVLLGDAEPALGEPVEVEGGKLDDKQREAVALALAAEDFALIHGPPGTGKTTTVAQLIREAVADGARVLACAPSNLAVDNIVERLVRLDVVRVGHPARILPTVHERSLAFLVEKHEDVRLARHLVREALGLFRKSDKKTRTRMARRERQELRQEAKRLMKDARRLERGAVSRILENADVVCATTSIDEQLLGDQHFDLVVIDEAGQSTEPGTWPPIVHADKVVLAGDHRQLPATVVSAEAARGGFGVSLFERLIERHPSAAVRLERQYRMHEAIMGFSSHELYDGALIADDTVARHTLFADEPPLEMIDTAGAGWNETVEPDGESRLNDQEAELVATRARALLDRGVAPQDIGVITPYAAQARRIRELLAVDDLEVDTVDGFQGREKDAILISFVRSNDEMEIGFLAEIRRTNVALTRARKKLLLVGDSATLSTLEFYARLFEYIEANGAYRTVWEL